MSVLFLDAIAPWLEGLARGLAQHGQVIALNHVDLRAQHRLGLPLRVKDGAFAMRTRRFPPGFAGTLAPLFATFIRHGIDRALARLEGAPKVIAPFPHAEPWLRHLPSDQLCYYNVDDYRLYNPSRQAHITAQEDALIRHAGLTVCVARFMADDMRRRHPDLAHRIHHVPHGIAPAFLNPAPELPPEAGLIGYLGNLSDRVDWAFVDEVVQQTPELTFEFIGHVGAEQADWAQTRARVFSRPNVRAPGPVSQANVPQCYWRSALNWMPYVVDHPFNHAASPTKIFDAFASGRPFVSSATPEALLYPDRIAIARSPAEAAALLRDLAASHNPATAVQLRDAAARNLWEHRAAQILDLFDA